jgi:hypothetical protein
LTFIPSYQILEHTPSGLTTTPTRQSHLFTSNQNLNFLGSQVLKYLAEFGVPLLLSPSTSFSLYFFLPLLLSPSTSFSLYFFLPLLLHSSSPTPRNPCDSVLDLIFRSSRPQAATRNMADSSSEGIGCRDLCRHHSTRLVQGKFTKSAFISTDSDSGLSAYFSPRLGDAVEFFMTFGYMYNLYGPDFDPSDEHTFDAYVVVEFCLECLRHLSTLYEPLQRQDASLVQAHAVEPTRCYVTYHEALARATELKEAVYRRLEQALKAIREVLSLAVGNSLQAEVGEQSFSSHLLVLLK